MTTTAAFLSILNTDDDNKKEQSKWRLVFVVVEMKRIEFGSRSTAPPPPKKKNKKLIRYGPGRCLRALKYHQVCYVCYTVNYANQSDNITQKESERDRERGSRFQ